MRIESTSLVDGESLQQRNVELSCGGENISPDLAWSGAPAETKSFAITCYDPDAPTGSGWWHWIAFDIPADIKSVPQGGPIPGREWENDYGYVGYGGACPPPGHGPHRYVFTVHALDVEHLGCGDGQTSAAVRFTLLQHVIDSATITPVYESAPENGLEATAEPTIDDADLPPAEDFR